METRKEEKSGKKWKRNSKSSSPSDSSLALINNLDDGCLMHILSFLSPIPDTTGYVEFGRFREIELGFASLSNYRHELLFEFADRYNTALVCHRWKYLACHPRLWLRVDRFLTGRSEPAPGVFPNVETAVAAARPGDTILIAAGGKHIASNIQINKPLCLIGGGELPDETTLICSRGSDSAFEFMSTCKLANLTVKAELGCCLLHRSGRLTIDDCVLQCESNPLDFLSCPIESTAIARVSKLQSDGVSVSRTRIEGGAKAVSTTGDLALQRVRVIYARTSIFFWFDVEHQS